MQTRPREDSYREIRNPSQTLGTKTEAPRSRSSTSISLLNINEEFCSSYVGRNDGYKGPSLHDLITATSPRLLPYDISATTPVRTTSAGTTSSTEALNNMDTCVYILERSGACGNQIPLSWQGRHVIFLINNGNFNKFEILNKCTFIFPAESRHDTILMNNDTT